MSPTRPYPPALQDVIRHAQRLRDYLARKESVTFAIDPAGPWITGRAGEVQCVVAIVALDWHERRISAEGAVATLARYLRDLHDGLAMHLDIEMPACCRSPVSKADSRSSSMARTGVLRPRA